MTTQPIQTITGLESILGKANNLVDTIVKKLPEFQPPDKLKNIKMPVDIEGYIPKEMLEKGNLAGMFDPYLFNWPTYVGGRFAHGTIEEVTLLTNEIVQMKVWIPGLPVLDDKLKKLCPANVMLMVDVKIDVIKITSNLNILLDVTLWVYCYMSARDNRIIQMPQATLNTFYAGQTVRVDKRPNNKMVILGIPFPYWPPHKYNCENKTAQVEKQIQPKPKQSTPTQRLEMAEIESNEVNVGPPYTQDVSTPKPQSPKNIEQEFEVLMEDDKVPTTPKEVIHEPKQKKEKKEKEVKPELISKKIRKQRDSEESSEEEESSKKDKKRTKKAKESKRSKKSKKQEAVAEKSSDDEELSSSSSESSEESSSSEEEKKKKKKKTVPPKKEKPVPVEGEKKRKVKEVKEEEEETAEPVKKVQYVEKKSKKQEAPVPAPVPTPVPISTSFKKPVSVLLEPTMKLQPVPPPPSSPKVATPKKKASPKATSAPVPIINDDGWSEKDKREWLEEALQGACKRKAIALDENPTAAKNPNYLSGLAYSEVKNKMINVLSMIVNHCDLDKLRDALPSPLPLTPPEEGQYDDEFRDFAQFVYFFGPEIWNVAQHKTSKPKKPVVDF